MIHFVLEPLFFLAWGFALRAAFRTPNRAGLVQQWVLVFGPLVMYELRRINESKLGIDRAVVFPETLLQAPGIRFPLAALLLSGVFVWGIVWLTQFTAQRIGKAGAAFVYVAAIALCYPIDMALTKSGYSVYPSRLPEHWQLYIYPSYLVYVSLTALLALVTALVIEKVRSRRAAPVTPSVLR